MHEVLTDKCVLLMRERYDRCVLLLQVWLRCVRGREGMLGVWLECVRCVCERMKTFHRHNLVLKQP